MSDEEEQQISEEPWLSWHGCLTGDCPHKAGECFSMSNFPTCAIHREAELCAEITRLRKEDERGKSREDTFFTRWRCAQTDRDKIKDDVRELFEAWDVNNFASMSVIIPRLRSKLDPDQDTDQFNEHELSLSQTSELARLHEQIQSAADELSGSTGLTPGDQIKIDSAMKMLDPKAEESGQ